MNQYTNVFITFGFLFLIGILYVVLTLSKPELWQRIRQEQNTTPQRNTMGLLIGGIFIFGFILNIFQGKDINSASGLSDIDTFLSGLILTLALGTWLRGIANSFKFWPVASFLLVSLISVIVSISHWLPREYEIIYAVLGAALGSAVDWWDRRRATKKAENTRNANGV